MSVSTFVIPEIAFPKSWTKLTINDDTSVTLPLVAAPGAGKRTFVLYGWITANAATDIKFKSYNGTTYTDIDGSVSLMNGTPFVFGKPPDGNPSSGRCFPVNMTNVNEQLVITNSNGARLGGAVFYVQQ